MCNRKIKNFSKKFSRHAAFGDYFWFLVSNSRDAENIFRLMFRGHIWCRLKSADTEIFFEKLGNLTVLTAKTPSGTVENIRNLEISEKDF